MENLDSSLMNNTLAPKEQDAAARKLKEEKSGAAGGQVGGDETDATGEQKTLRQRVQEARQASNIKERVKEKIKEKVLSPLKKITSRALQWAWKALLPSWGLSSIWINIHVFLKGVFGEELFCKLGEEWLPPKAVEATGGAGKIINKSAGLVEVMVLIFIDVIIFFVVVGFVAMFTDESTFKTMTGEVNKAQPAATQSVK
ncbi:MAG: hypothetical protein WCV70_04080 [Patescibacteria group bacterium]|jgi:hypothetical protein